MGKRFERGEFLRKDTKKGSFMIYEGNNLSSSSYKMMSLVCFYDPEKYQMGPIGYETKPSLEVGTKLKPCATTIDTEEEDFWIKRCSENEKDEALRILAKHGLYWDEKDLALVDITSGEVIRKIVIPDDKYYGQIIRPKSNKFKELIKKCCVNKVKVETRYQGCYDEYYD